MLTTRASIPDVGNPGHAAGVPSKPLQNCDEAIRAPAPLDSLVRMSIAFFDTMAFQIAGLSPQDSAFLIDVIHVHCERLRKARRA